jgi:NAD(P)-dependent dehydrogenase (short-subunit alcohol dehydrogenase family)
VLFAREGADVAIQYLYEDADAAVTRDAVVAEGRRAILIPGNVGDRKSCQTAVERTVREFGGLDELVNNAAFQAHSHRLEDLSEEHLDLTIRTNLHGYHILPVVGGYGGIWWAGPACVERAAGRA